MLLPRLLSTFVLVPIIATAGPLSARDAEPDRASQEMLDSLVEISGVPGFGAAVWSDGEVIWTGSSGKRDLESDLPVDGHTRFRLASVSKLLAVTAAAKLAEEGRLDLNAPVSTLLPWLPNDWAPINLRQLAAHTSGLPHYQDIDADRGQRHFSTGRDAVGNFSGRELLYAPGSVYSYSSWGYTLIGAVVEEVSRESFGDFISKEIARGLTITLDATDSGEPDVSAAYQFADKLPVKAPPHDFSYTWAGGGMMANAESLVTFGGQMLEHKIVRKDTFDAMLAPFKLASGAAAGEDGYTVGFGWRASRDSDDKPIAFHNGTAIGARSSLVLWREEGTAVAILSNASWVSSIDMTAQMLASPFRPKPIGLVDSSCPLQATRYEGRFGDIPVAGDARFNLIDGLCRGELTITGGLADYFAGGPQPGANRVVLVGVDGDAGLSRAGLVTPFGIYDFRARHGATFTAQMSSARTLELAFLE